MQLKAKPEIIGVIAAAVVCSGAVALLSASHAQAKRDNYSLVPPPPPTPVLQVPPPPVMVPYDYAYANPDSSVLFAPSGGTNVAIIHPHPAPKPTPRPTGAHPAANSPNLSIAYARARGFGAPRSTYLAREGPGAAEAFPQINAPAINTWFDASLRWYANHVNAQQFYSELAAQPERSIASTGYASASGMFDDVLPTWTEQAYRSSSPAPRRTTHGGGRRHHHGRHGHRVVAYR